MVQGNDGQRRQKEGGSSLRTGEAEIYVTFETEEGQRNALNKLSVGLIAAATDASGKVPLEDR
jgi:hypothetical protein